MSTLDILVPVVTTDRFMVQLLNDACPKDVADDDGWATFVIETHCIMTKIKAKKLVVREPAGLPSGWMIKSFEEVYA
jgi:hypothetical protein